jgi:carbamate kinase
MLVVVALGDDVHQRHGGPWDAAVQRANIKVAAEAVAPLATMHQLVLTHGNESPAGGPLTQPGLAHHAGPTCPLDVLDAEREGMVGYLLEQELGRHLPRHQLATLLTQVLVDAADPAFSHPTRAVGPAYEADEARGLATLRGWAVAPDTQGWRRVVASPEPRQIIELATIRILVERGVIVTCAGGGGIPVVVDSAGGLRGVDAVVDQDLAAALLATSLGADVLLLLSEVDAVYEGWGSDNARPIREITVDRLRALSLTSASVTRKVDAVCRFVESGGWLGAIGGLSDAGDILGGTAGTTVRGHA